MENNTNKVYLVYADVYTGRYGMSNQLVGIYSDENLAEKEIESLKLENPKYKVYCKTIKLNERYPLFCWWNAPYCDNEEEYEKQLELEDEVIKLGEYME